MQENAAWQPSGMKHCLLRATARGSLENVLLPERRQSPCITLCKIAFVGQVQRRQSYPAGSSFLAAGAGWGGARAGRGAWLRGTASPAGVMKMLQMDTGGGGTARRIP